MTTLVAAEKLYRFYNKCEGCSNPLYINRLVDNIGSVEWLCYKVGKAVLKNPGKKIITLSLKMKQSDWLIDPRIFSTARRALGLKYGTIDFKVEVLSLTICWESSKIPVLNKQDHLNCKLFKAIVSNKTLEVIKMLNRGAQINAIGPFEMRPLDVVFTNPDLAYRLVERGALSAEEEDLSEINH